MATVQVIFEGQDKNFTASVQKIQKEMDALDKNLRAAGVSSAAYNKALAQTKTSSMGAVEGIKNFISANAAAIGVVTAVGAAAVKAYNEFQRYAGEVRDLSLITQTGAEETSRFLQVIDDYQLSAADATAATKALKEQGLVPTIDTLAKLADQYKQIKDPAEKMAFIQDNLGRGGAKWVNVLNQEGDALREAAGEIDKNLILTDEQIKKAEAARLAQDAWNDSIQGFKIAIGSAIGEMIASIDATKKMTDQARELGIIHDGMNDRMKNMAFEAFRGQMERGAAMTEYYNKQLAETGDIAKMTEEELKNLSAANADIIRDSIELTTANKNYQESQAEILAQVAELTAQKQTLLSQGWWAESDAVKDVQGKIDELNSDYEENAAAFEEASVRKLTMMSLEKIAMLDGVAGYSDAEAAKAQALLTTAGVAEESALRQAIAFDQASTAIANGTVKAQELDALLKLMSERGYSIDVAMNIINRGYAGYGSGASYATGDLQYQNPTTPHAMGGSFMIPPSYGNEGFRMGNGDTASGGELITITPRGAAQSGSVATISDASLDKLAMRLEAVIQRSMVN